MVCKNCGKEVKEGTKFCTDCGAPVQAGAAWKHTADRIISSLRSSSISSTISRISIIIRIISPVRLIIPAPVTSVGKYILWLILSTIPTAGFIIMIVFALDKTDKNRANFGKAMLITQVCGIAVGIITLIVLAVLGFSVSDEIAGEFANDLTLMM